MSVLRTFRSLQTGPWIVHVYRISPGFKLPPERGGRCVRQLQRAPQGSLPTDTHTLECEFPVTIAYGDTGGCPSCWGAWCCGYKHCRLVPLSITHREEASVHAVSWPTEACGQGAEASLCQPARNGILAMAMTELRRRADPGRTPRGLWPQTTFRGLPIRDHEAGEPAQPRLAAFPDQR